MEKKFQDLNFYMSKKTKKIVANSDEAVEEFAETMKIIYESFLKKGFTTEQSFRLLVLVMSKQM